VVHRAGRRDDEVLRAVVAAVVRDDRVALGGLDVLGAAADGTAERVVPQDGLEEALARDVARVVVRHGELLEDDAPLGLELVGVDEAGGDHVGEHVDGHAEVAIADLGVVAGVLLGGDGVVLAAHGVEGHGDVERRTGRRALEEEVLEEVRRPQVARLLVAGADGHPHADRGAAAAGHVLAEDADARREDAAPHPGSARRADGELRLVEGEFYGAGHRRHLTPRD
jgi:hypothetical protein